MSKIVKGLSIVFVFVIIFTSFAVGTYNVAGASGATRGYVHATGVNVRKSATTSSPSLGMVSEIYVTVNSQTSPGDGYIWYNITTDYGLTGYIRGDLITIISAPATDAEFEKSLEAFPESYRDSLRALHAVYPNWVFIADNLSMSFDEAVRNEAVGDKKLVHSSEYDSWKSMGEGVYNWENGSWNYYAGDWVAAAKQVVEYYMDPRNFLDSSYIYTFMKQSYSAEYDTEETVEAVVKNTFLANSYYDPNDTAYGGSYIKVLLEAARQSGVNPSVLASTLIQEQGSAGSSELISGESGYYNFFNIKANGSDPVANGLAYAKQQGWTTRSKAIIDGAAFYGNNYIKAGQDTYFYKNYNLCNENNLYYHQYAQNVADSASSAAILRRAFYDKYDAKLVFRIPVYTSFPEEAVAKPEKNSLRNNYYLTSLSSQLYWVDFSMYKQEYVLSLAGDTILYVKTGDGASIVSPSQTMLFPGNNTVDIVVKAQTGYTNTYRLNISTDQACTLIISSDESLRLTGDVNGDAKIDILDFVAIKKIIVGLSPDKYGSADLDNNGVVNSIDIVLLNKKLLGTETFSGDLNRDFKIDMLDLVCMKKIINGQATDKYKTADLDNNGVVDEADIALLTEMML